MVLNINRFSTEMVTIDAYKFTVPVQGIVIYSCFYCVKLKMENIIIPCGCTIVAFLLVITLCYFFMHQWEGGNKCRLRICSIYF